MPTPTVWLQDGRGVDAGTGCKRIKTSLHKQMKRARRHILGTASKIVDLLGRFCALLERGSSGVLSLLHKDDITIVSNVYITGTKNDVDKTTDRAMKSVVVMIDDAESQASSH